MSECQACHGSGRNDEIGVPCAGCVDGKIFGLKEWLLEQHFREKDHITKLAIACDALEKIRDGAGGAVDDWEIAGEALRRIRDSDGEAGGAKIKGESLRSLSDGKSSK